MFHKGFYPVELERHGLTMALRALAERNRRSSEIAVVVQSDEDSNSTKLDGPLTIQLFRIAQEAVQNADRHSHAQNILIRLAILAEQITLTVEDDGVGFPPDVGNAAGMGLRIMQHRACMIGGKLEINNSPEGGAMTICSVPVRERTLSAENPERSTSC